MFSLKSCKTFKPHKIIHKIQNEDGKAKVVRSSSLISEPTTTKEVIKVVSRIEVMTTRNVLNLVDLK